MKTEILKIKGDWQEVVDDCRATVKKPELGHEPSDNFKRKMVIAEHAPIRDIVVKFRWKNIPYWIAMHWKTHHWESRCNTQRNDRQNQYDRKKAPQDALVDFTGDPNVQNLIDTWRKRLCWQAAPETREYAEDFKVVLHDYLPEVSDALVPNCVYRCGCPEMTTCPYAKEHGKSYFNHLMMKSRSSAPYSVIKNRYQEYNRIFWKERNG